MPRIFVVNWFRKDDDGKFIWPGFGENSRVLEWVFRRCNGEGETVETPIGLVPGRGRDQHRRARRSPTIEMRELLTVDAEALRRSSRRSRSTWPGSATSCRTRSRRSSRR